MHLHHPIGGKSLIGGQIDGLIAPDFRAGVLANPTLVQEINGSGVFDDFEEVMFPFLAVFAAIKKELGFSAYLSSMDAEFCYFLGRPFGSENLNPGACFFQGLLVPGQALNDLCGPVSNVRF